MASRTRSSAWSVSASARPRSPSASAVCRCAIGARASGSTGCEPRCPGRAAAMIAVDWAPSIPRASSKIATTASAAQAVTTERLVSTGRAQRRGGGRRSGRRIGHAGEDGPCRERQRAQHERSTIEAIVLSKVPRAQSPPERRGGEQPSRRRCRRARGASRGHPQGESAERRDLERGDRDEDRGGDRCLERGVDGRRPRTSGDRDRGRDEDQMSVAISTPSRSSKWAWNSARASCASGTRNSANAQIGDRAAA